MKTGIAPPKRQWRGSGLVEISMLALSTLMLAGFAPGDDHALRDKLVGTWQQSDPSGETKSTWTLKNSGDSMHVNSSNDTQTVADFDCNTLGKECEIKSSGHKSKVSMWFNGPKLVELETTGSQVVKRRFTVTGDGDSMELETIPMVPGGSSRTTHFKRVAADASTK